MRCERPDYGIEHRDRGDLQSPAAVLQHLAQHVVHHREENKAVIDLNAGKHAIDLAACSHHAPDMLDRLGFIELNEAGARNRVDRIPGRIGNQMKMKPVQRHKSLAPSGACSTLWTDRRQAGANHGIFPARDSCPRCGHLDSAVINRISTFIPVPSRSGEAGPYFLFSQFYPCSPRRLSTRPPYRL